MTNARLLLRVKDRDSRRAVVLPVRLTRRIALISLRLVAACHGQLRAAFGPEASYFSVRFLGCGVVACRALSFCITPLT